MLVFPLVPACGGGVCVCVACLYIVRGVHFLHYFVVWGKSPPCQSLVLPMPGRSELHSIF